MASKWSFDFLLHIISTYLSALGLQLFFLKMLGISKDFSWITTALVCAASIIVLLLMTYRFSIFLFISAVVSVVVFLLAFFSDVLSEVYEYASRFFEWFVPFLSNPAARNDNFEFTLFLSLICLVSFLCFVFASLMESTVLLVLLTVIPVITLSIVSRQELPYLLLLPTVFGVILQYSLTAKTSIRKDSSEVTKQTGYLQTLFSFLPLILTGLVIASVISYSYPAESLRSENIRNSTNDILSALHLPLPSTSNRSSFNLGGLGYYPLHERLGGPAFIDNSDVMKVTSGSDLLLRGATYNQYEKIFWSSSSSLFSNRFHSDLLSGRTRDFFDMDRPDSKVVPEDLYAAVMEEQTVTVSILSSQMGSTLFSADHLLDIENTKSDVYYNESSEIFQNENIAFGETYNLTISHFKTGGPDYKKNLLALEAYIRANPEAGDSPSHIKEIQDTYLSVSVPDSVRNYALALTDNNTQTPLEKVFAIREDLLTNFTYSLDVDVPPQDSDFIEHFLATKTGYCTYFASAMTVMAQINGIPARYVEGFVVDVPDTSTKEKPGSVTVTGKNGHAWCEVYINGIGWIPIDATASSTPGGGSLSEGNSQESGQSPDSYEYQPPDSGYVPPHGTSTAATPDEDSGSFLSQASGILRWLLVPLILLVLLLAVILILISSLRWNRHFTLTPPSGHKKETPPEEMAGYLLQRAMNHLLLMNICIEPTETVSDFSKRLQNIPVYTQGCKMDTYVFDIRRLAGLYDKWIYGRITPSGDELDAAFSECMKLKTDIKNAHKTRFSYLLHIMLRAR